MLRVGGVEHVGAGGVQLSGVAVWMAAGVIRPIPE